MKTLAITLLEQDNSEAPNIGTIVSEPISEDTLRDKFKEAVESHFVAEVTSIRLQDGLLLKELEGSAPVDIYVTLDGEYEVVIEAQQTWIY